MTEPLTEAERIANELYVRVVQPDTIWWDDLTPEMQAGWLRAASWVAAERERTAALVEAALAIVDFFEGEAVFTQGTERESWSRMEAHHYVELQDHLLVDLEAALEARR